MITPVEEKALRASLDGYQAVFAGRWRTAKSLARRRLVVIRKVPGLVGLSVIATSLGREVIAEIDRGLAEKAAARERLKVEAEEARMRPQQEHEQRLLALPGKRVRLFRAQGDSPRQRELVVVEGVVELRGEHLVVPAPDGRCPFFVHAKRRVEMVG